MPGPFRLDQRRAVVTGGASGIGEATVRVLAAAGALVTILDVDGDRAQTLAREVGPAASAAALDITDEAAVQAFFDGLALCRCCSPPHTARS
jgi:NAD(P)-dependent dehydrogenase (short-subunit alcohol dehydrogenase family)